MGAVVISIVSAAFVLAGAVWLANAVLRKVGDKTIGDLGPAARRLFWLTMGVALIFGAFDAWALITRHDALAVAVLIAVFVVPECVLIPLRIRRARRAARLSRARRTRSDPRST